MPELSASPSPSVSVPPVSSISTRHVDPADRVEVWEEYNRQALVGLTCSSYSEHGLLASQTNTRLGSLRLADIAGNAHVIERTPKTCRALPKDSVFASLLVTGQAMFLYGGGCHTLTAGDLILYDTRRPYLFGFPHDMRQLLVDIPRDVFTEHCADDGVPTPLLFSRGRRTEGGHLSALRSLLTHRGHANDPESDATTVLDLIRALAVGGPPDGGSGRLSSLTAPISPPAQLTLARDCIERRLPDPRLSTAQVAEELGVSTRQLSRIFEPAGVSPARHILERRLSMAHAHLADPDHRHLTVAQIAHHWGFASQAHFTRVFRARFGHTPGELRTSSPPDQES